MDLEKKISKIYEVIADKTLSFGCKYSTRYGKPNDDTQLDDMIDGKKLYSQIGNSQIETVDGPYESLPYFIEVWGELENTNNYGHKYKHLNYEIIGHPVMVGDIINRLEKNYNSSISLDYGDGSDFAKIVLDIISSFLEKNKPIEEQKEECIDFIYSLIILMNNKQINFI